MLRFPVEGGFANIVQTVSELPDPCQSELKFVDVETTNFGKKRKAIYPYLGDRICGIAASFADSREAYYVPIRHTQEKGNLPLDVVLKWAKDLLSFGEVINHNIKFDLHFFAVDGVLFDRNTIVRDTLQYAKLIDSERLDQGLKTLAKDYLGYSAIGETSVKRYLESINSEDYARVPIDILGGYAACDVLFNKDLYWFLVGKKHEELNWVWDNETKLTATLWQMERHGVKFDKDKVRQKQHKMLKVLIENGEFIEKETGGVFTGSNQNLQEIMLHKLGLPVIVWNEPSKKTRIVSPNFGKKTMQKYLVLPEVAMSDKKFKVVQAVTKFLSASSLYSAFKSWEELSDEKGFLHASFNPNVRTGRPSARDPNLFGMNKFTKEAIIPDSPNHSFFLADASQIEFRWIVKTIKQPELIEEYQKKPRADFHTMAGEMTGGGRDFGKTCNFMIGFGAGERKTISEVASNAKVMKSVLEQVDQLVRDGVISESSKLATYQTLSHRRATDLFRKYHEKLYNLRHYSKLAEEYCKRNGFVRNEFGRRRHLFRNPITGEIRSVTKDGRTFTFAHKAFNTFNQGSAIDFIKAKLNLLSDFYNPTMREADLTLRVNVYDEAMFCGPSDVVSNPAMTSYVMDTLEEPPKGSPIAFPWDSGHSARSWADAKD